MKLKDILRGKGAVTHSIAPTSTLQEVVDQLVKFNCGSLLVVDGQRRLRGIITERDILRAAEGGRVALKDCRVADHMSSDLLVGTPTDSLADAMGWMTENRVRHLPIMEADQLVGIVSIGDLVKAQHDHLSMENHYLKNYIQS